MSTITLELIEANWAKDSKMDLADLNIDSSRQAELHHKYHKALNWARKELRSLEVVKKKMVHLKTDYYEGQLPPQQVKELGWEPNRRKVFKQDLDRFLDADEDIIEVNLKIGDMNDLVDYCQSIIRTINQRPFVVKNIIENQKFLNGVN